MALRRPRREAWRVGPGKTVLGQSRRPPPRRHGLAVWLQSHGWMVRLNCRVAWRPSPSVTFIVKTNVPAVVGVPDSWLPMMAGAFGELSARPGGGWPGG